MLFVDWLIDERIKSTFNYFYKHIIKLSHLQVIYLYIDTFVQESNFGSQLPYQAFIKVLFRSRTFVRTVRL
jgi:hypothetical protein